MPYPRLVVFLVLAAFAMAACDSVVAPPGTVPPDDEPPARIPVVAQVEMTGFTTAFVSWATADTVAVARLHVGRPGEALTRVVEGAGSAGMVLGGLEPDTDYAVAVALRRGEAEVGRSDTVAFRTLPSASGVAGLSSAFLQEVVARLSGHLPVRDTTRLRSRSDSLDRRRAAEYLRDRLAAMGLDAAFHEYRWSVPSGVEGSGQNVFAAVPATAPSDEWVVIGSHYDSVQGSPGAIDNASGVAITLALADRLSRLASRSVNVMVAFFDEEENNLKGSKAFADRLRAQGLTVRSMHNFEMTGWDGDGDRALDFEVGYAPREVLVAYRLAATEPASASTLQEWPLVGRSDHVSFYPAAVVLSEEFRSGDRTPFYHSPGDTYDTVDFAYLLSATRVGYHALAFLLADG